MSILPWPANKNYNAAMRHVDSLLRDHGWNGSRRETAIAELLDDLLKERYELRTKVYGPVWQNPRLREQTPQKSSNRELVDEQGWIR